MYLRIIENPLEPYSGKAKQVSYIPGEPVFNYVKAALMLPDEETGIILNGRIVNIEESKYLIPDPDDFIIAVPIIGGGDNNNQILAMIVMIIISVYLGPQAGAAASTATGGGAAMAAWNFWGWAAYIGVQALGGYLMNQWFSQKAKEASTGSPTYGWNIQPLFGQNQPIPVTFGKIKTAGQIVSSYIDYQGSQQYVNVLIEAGEGPCDYIGNGENANCTGISKIKINGNPIANYTGTMVYKRAGLNNQSVVPNFDDVITQKQLSYCINNGGPGDWFTDTMLVDGNGLRITFNWPAGLRYNEKDGDRGTLIEKIQVEYKLSTESEWTAWDEFEIAQNIGIAFWNTYRKDNLTKGIYNVRCKCTFVGILATEVIVVGHDNSGSPIYETRTYYLQNLNTSRDQYLCYWSSLDSVIYDNFIRPNKILLGIKALASDRLSGNFTITFELSRSNVWVYNPIIAAYEQKPANNPAWASYWILHRVYYLRDINTGEWKFIVRGISAERIIYNEFADWADFCTERGLEINIIFDTKQKIGEALKIVCEMGRGAVLNRTSRYGCVFDGPADKDEAGNIIPDQVFNMSNIILDSFSEQFVDISERSTAIEVTFPDRDNDFERTTILVPADNLNESEVLENITQITWNGCTSYTQAWKEAKYRLRLNQYLCNTGSWKADVEAIKSSLGQVVMLQHDVPAFGRGGRIVSATENTITLDQSILNDIQGNSYYDPAKTYQVLIRLADDSIIYKLVDSVDETGTVITLTEAFLNDIDSNSKFADEEHFETAGDLTGIYIAGKEIQIIYNQSDFIISVINSNYDAGIDKTIVEIFNHTLNNVAFIIRYAWTMPKADDSYNFGELQKHSKPFKIGSIQRNGDIQFTITGLEYIDELYTEATDIPDIEYSYLEPIFEVSGIALKEETFRQLDGTMISRLNCSWTIPVGKMADAFLVYYSIDGTNWIYYESTPVAYSFIENVKTGTAYRIKIIVRKGILNSAGIISSEIIIIGKDINPSDVTSLSISQDDAMLTATITLVDDPDVDEYELRLGPSLENSYKVIPNFRGPVTDPFKVPKEGLLVFWCRAVDRSGNFSVNAISYTIQIFNIPPENAIYKEDIDLTSLIPTQMWFGLDKQWHQKRVEKIGDFPVFADIFRRTTPWTLAANSQLDIPTKDLGADVLEPNCFWTENAGYIHLRTVQRIGDFPVFADIFRQTTSWELMKPDFVVKTFLGINAVWNQALNNRLDIYYRTKTDGDQWTEWKPSTETKFLGRQIQIKLVPVSLDGQTDVVISAVSIQVDVPEVNEPIKRTDIPVEGLDYTYKRRFIIIPDPWAFCYDINGITRMPLITNKTKTGCRFSLLDDDGNPIAGRIAYGEVPGW